LSREEKALMEKEEKEGLLRNPSKNMIIILFSFREATCMPGFESAFFFSQGEKSCRKSP
jgi:hypothetical protein